MAAVLPIPNGSGIPQWVFCPASQVPIKQTRFNVAEQKLFIDQEMVKGGLVLQNHLLPKGRGIREF